MSTGVSLTEEEASVLRELDNRLSKVRSIKLNIPSINVKEKGIPNQGYGYPTSIHVPNINLPSNNNHSNYNTNNKNNNSNNNNNNNFHSNFDNYLSSNYSPHPPPHSSSPSSSSISSHTVYTSSRTSPRRNATNTHAHAQRNAWDAEHASAHRNDAESHAGAPHGLMDELRKERRKVEQMGIRSSSSSSVSSIIPVSSSSHYVYPSSSSSSSIPSSSSPRHSSHYKQPTPRQFNLDNRNHHEKRHNERDGNENNFEYNGYEETTYKNTKTHKTTSDKPPLPNKPTNNYFHETELEELNERIKAIEMEFGVEQPTNAKNNTKNTKKQEREPPIYNGYLSSLLAPNPRPTENGSSVKRMDFMPSDWTDEKSMLLPPPQKLEVEELKQPKKTKKPKPIISHGADKERKPTSKKPRPKETDSPPITARAISPILNNNNNNNTKKKKREISSFASPKKVRMMSEDLPKPILPPDRQTRASSIRSSLARKKDPEVQEIEKKPKHKTTQNNSNNPRFVDNPSVSLYGSFSPPMSRVQPKILKKKSDTDDDKRDFSNTKTDICLSHSVKKQKGKCPVCTSIRRK